MSIDTYQIAVKPSDGKREEFLDKFEEPDSVMKCSKITGNYNNEQYVFYSAEGKDNAEEVKEKALDTELVKDVFIDKF